MLAPITTAWRFVCMRTGTSTGSVRFAVAAQAPTGRRSTVVVGHVAAGVGWRGVRVGQNGSFDLKRAMKEQ